MLKSPFFRFFIINIVLNGLQTHSIVFGFYFEFLDDLYFWGGIWLIHFLNLVLWIRLFVAFPTAAPFLRNGLRCKLVVRRLPWLVRALSTLPIFGAHVFLSLHLLHILLHLLIFHVFDLLSLMAVRRIIMWDIRTNYLPYSYLNLNSRHYSDTKTYSTTEIMVFNSQMPPPVAKTSFATINIPKNSNFN